MSSHGCELVGAHCRRGRDVVLVLAAILELLQRVVYRPVVGLRLPGVAGQRRALNLLLLLHEVEGLHLGLNKPVAALVVLEGLLVPLVVVLHVACVRRLHADRHARPLKHPDGLRLGEGYEDFGVEVLLSEGLVVVKQLAEVGGLGLGGALARGDLLLLGRHISTVGRLRRLRLGGLACAVREEALGESRAREALHHRQLGHIALGV
mmetsp:Transcript_37592/g.89314  ORF Transcript_37592/g.89314 Transcript_37592/m.89314 type:complete len:207 (+) Transcript_37592:1922-2542(+)